MIIISLFLQFLLLTPFFKSLFQISIWKILFQTTFLHAVFWTALAKLAFQTTFLQRWLKGKCDQGGRLTGSKRVKG